MPVLRRGDRGAAVAEVRAKLTALGLLPTDPGPAVTGDVFDDACDEAVRGFQQSRGLRADGLVGAETMHALEEAGWRLGDRVLYYAPNRPFTGDDVGDLQHRLAELGFDVGRCDGIFGARTADAVRELQRGVGLPSDGTVGRLTLDALRRLARTVVGGSATRMREEAVFQQAGPTLAGKVVVVDPGHGGDDHGAESGDLTEATVVEDIAYRLEGRLAALGALPFLTRGPGFAPPDVDRAGFANEAVADLLVSLHVDGSRDPACNGVATYYYGTVAGRTSTSSALGERLAQLIQEEVVDRTDLLDCRVHPKTWELLRLTRMPAVRAELGYLTNPGDAARLRSADFRDTLAEAVAVAVQRLYLPTVDEVGRYEQSVLAL